MPDSSLIDPLEDDHQRPIDGINITPFVDVMLVLLVIFMVTAPLLEQGVDLDLPETTSQALTTEPHLVQIGLDRKGKITLDGERVADHEALYLALVQRSQSREGAPSVRLYADHRQDYGVVVAVLAAIQRAGVSAIDLVTNPEGRGR